MPVATTFFFKLNLEEKLVLPVWVHLVHPPGHPVVLPEEGGEGGREEKWDPLAFLFYLVVIFSHFLALKKKLCISGNSVPEE